MSRTTHLYGRIDYCRVGVTSLVTDQNEFVGEQYERPWLNYDADASQREKGDKGGVDESPRVDDGYTSAATDFHPHDTDDPKHWKQLRRRHERVDEDAKREQREHTIDARRYAKTACTTFDFADRTTSRVLTFLDKIGVKDVDRTTSFEAIVLAYTTLAANENGRQLRTEGVFDQFRVDSEVDYEEVTRLRKLIRKTDEWNTLERKWQPQLPDHATMEVDEDELVLCTDVDPLDADR